jgi:hypothetical protein
VNAFPIKNLPALRVLVSCFLTRKTEIEKILYSVNTDPTNTAKEIANTEYMYGFAFRAQLDLIQGVEKVTGIQLLIDSERKLNWRRLTLGGRMVANG